MASRLFYMVAILWFYGLRVSEGRNAICMLKGKTVSGYATFTQNYEDQNMIISVTAYGLDPIPEGSNKSDKHGFHIHKYGDLTNECKSAAGHYNPFGHDHAGPNDAVRHVGDLGNVRQNADGNIFATFIEPVASLFGEYSILGRAAVLHEDEDDLGLGGFEDSKTTGHAGARLACCVIGWAHQIYLP